MRERKVSARMFVRFDTNWMVQQPPSLSLQYQLLLLMCKSAVSGAVRADPVIKNLASEYRGFATGGSEMKYSYIPMREIVVLIDALFWRLFQVKWHVTDA